ncbi:hypothetical protein K445DRAFT_27538 [Daldinia sp. EC12]|nr:hypothetical protein K445DRAFT_27538 [Daldinia sp. EC12]
MKRRVVVDYKSYLRLFPSQRCRLRQESLKNESNNPDSDDDNGSSDDEISTKVQSQQGTQLDRFEELYEVICKKYKMENISDLLLLSPARVPAYEMKTKQWGRVLINQLKPVNPDRTAFELLRIDEDIKDLVNCLVQGHHSRVKDTFDDFTTSKGKGLVILLHGPPGTGKTLTAESMAEQHALPLYIVSGGELSTDVSTVEETLQSIFELCKRWGAILLVDEADVIMSTRKSAELERSAIVAVWLKLIEYYEGVVFLTSNLLEELDKAFMSRIHLSVELEALDPTKRAAIWKNIIEFNQEVVNMKAWEPEIYAILGGLEVNGRVIKNLVRIAVFYARSKGDDTRLSPHHLATVMKAELSKDKNIKKVVDQIKQLTIGS